MKRIIILIIVCFASNMFAQVVWVIEDGEALPIRKITVHFQESNQINTHSYLEKWSESEKKEAKEAICRLPHGWIPPDYVDCNCLSDMVFDQFLYPEFKILYNSKGPNDPSIDDQLRERSYIIHRELFDCIDLINIELLTANSDGWHSPKNREKTALLIHNASEKDIICEWINHDGKVREESRIIKPEEGSIQYTYSGHVFHFRDAKTGDVLNHFVASKTPGKVVFDD